MSKLNFFAYLLCFSVLSSANAAVKLKSPKVNNVWIQKGTKQGDNNTLNCIYEFTEVVTCAKGCDHSDPTCDCEASSRVITTGSTVATASTRTIKAKGSVGLPASNGGVSCEAGGSFDCTQTTYKCTPPARR